MTDKAKPEKPAKKGKLKPILIGLVALLVIGGGGAAAGFFLAGTSADAHAADPDVPQLVPREGAHEETAAPAASGGHGESPATGAEPRVDPTRYTATYHSIEAPFTSNLNESTAFVQMAIGVSTYYDARVVDAVKAHEPAIRSAVLMQLAATDEALIANSAGRQQLQRDLTRVINQVLREKTGFGGIDNVYFTSFVVQ